MTSGARILAPDAEALSRAMRALGPLSDADLDALAARASVRRLEAGAFLLRAGETAELGALVLAGVLREYWPLTDGSERTKGFAREGDLVGSLADLVSGAPSRSFVQAVTEAHLITVRWRDFDALRAASPAWNEVARCIAERLYLAKSEREWELVAMGAEARYERFLARWPGLEERVSQAHVASYLSVTPEHLSRIRRRRRDAAPATR